MIKFDESNAFWRAAFIDKRDDASGEEQLFFRTQLLEVRKRVEPLVARISRDMPGFTIHDITHLDSLWDTANLLAHPNHRLNPPEAFVFGVAVLLHDAGMTLAAYSGGINDLKETSEWKDITALAEKRGAKPAETQVAAEVLRRLHALKGMLLATSPISDYVTHSSFYLIEHKELREFYGENIGIVAQSHWWPISKVETELDRHLGGMSPETNLNVDLLKVACILRVADAVHLDRRRALPVARFFEKPTGVSADHWAFQGRLGFPRIADAALIFSAGQATPVEEAESWWQAYDAIGIADRELRATNLLLESKKRPSLQADRVMGAGRPLELARVIQTIGWKPIDTGIRVTNVGHLVRLLGGSALYGEDPVAPIRELIQNALDAIQARRRLQERHDWGRITVGLYEADNDVWLFVEDNGVGMSEGVLTGPLLDFGFSFWRSSEIISEFPSLASRGMEASGRYGIGFFSVFMVADEIKVTSRHFRLAEADALTLCFEGLSKRPIICHARGNGVPLDGGTRVDIRLRHDPRQKQSLTFRCIGESIKPQSFGTIIDDRVVNTFTDLKSLVEWVAPASPVDIDVCLFGETKRGVSANDWLRESSQIVIRRALLNSRSSGVPSISENVQNIYEADGSIVGRGALYPSYHGKAGILVAGGLRVGWVPNLLGILLGEPDSAARSSGRAFVSVEALKRWAIEQAPLIEKSQMSDEEKALCADIILECGGSVGKLPLARKGAIWLNLASLRRLIRSSDFIHYHIGDIDYDESDSVREKEFEEEFEESKDLIIIPRGRRNFINDPQQDRMLLVPKSYIYSLLESEVKKIWKLYDESYDSEFVVGTCSHEEILRDIEVLERKVKIDDQ